MIIVYASNTGYTKQYAELLAERLGISAFPVNKVPSYLRGSDAIFMGWLMAANIVGYMRAKLACNVRCIVGVGMSPESEELEQVLRDKGGFGPTIPLFYLQGGYDFNKLSGVYKAMMSVKSKEILSRYEGRTEEEKNADATYRMITQGYSVVSPERLDRIVEWAESIK